MKAKYFAKFAAKALIEGLVPRGGVVFAHVQVRGSLWPT